MTSAASRRKTPSTRHFLMLSVAVAIVTIVVKTAAWYLTGSVSLLSDAMESFVNLASAMFGLSMVTVAARPPDEDHPYGHHKAEYFSSGFEGVLIVAAACGIVWAAASRFLHPQPIEAPGLGLVLSIASSSLNGVLAWAMFRAAKVHRSIALEADARHLVTDVWTSVGVVVGILAVMATGWLWLDPLVAIGVALNILREGWSLLWQSGQALMDEAVEPEVLKTIQDTLSEFELRNERAHVVRFDHVTTRRAGQRRFVDLHMHMPSTWTLGRAAAVRMNVEQALMSAVPGLRATIQLLPSHIEAHIDDPEDKP